MVDALARFAQVRQFGSLFHYELAPERGLVLFRAVRSCLKDLNLAQTETSLLSVGDELELFQRGEVIT
jgi:hypothetical protein